jgi:hypothetical protein
MPDPTTPFEAALWQFVRVLRTEWNITPVRMVVYFAEDMEYPMRLNLQGIDRAICQEALNPPPPPEGPAQRKK